MNLASFQARTESLADIKLVVTPPGLFVSNGARDFRGPHTQRELCQNDGGQRAICGALLSYRFRSMEATPLWQLQGKLQRFRRYRSIRSNQLA